MGLSVLPYMEIIYTERKRIVDTNNQKLESYLIQRPRIIADTIWNNSYYPIILDSEETLLKLVNTLNANGIFPRRYFYPSLCNLPYVNKREMKISDSIANRILCLPLFVGLDEDARNKICSIILNETS